MTSNENAINWFEISVSDIARAKKFYENILGIEMQLDTMMGMDMAYFPYEPGSGKASGALVKSDMHTPSGDGAKIYLNGNPDLSDALGKVESAGGKVVMPKTEIAPEVGHMAFFTDTEGNVVALHSQH
ncbi:MAG: VOC family protein [Chitinophagales bacterium]